MNGSRVLLVLTVAFVSGGMPRAQRPRVERAAETHTGRATTLGPDSSARRTNIDVSRAPGPQNEVTIAIAPDDPLNLVVAAHDYRTNLKHVGVWTSFDAGRTWSGGLMEALGVYGFQGDPALAAHRNGVFLLCYIDHDGVGSRVAVARSDDGGKTWPSIGVVADHPTPDGVFEDKPYIAVDDTGGPFDGYVYVSWVRFPPTGRPRILCARSTDGGATFEPPARLSPRIASVTGPVPAVGPAGELYVAWRSGDSIRFSRSLDGGVTFDPQRLVAQSIPLPSPLPGAVFRVSPFPTLAVDRSGGPDHGTLYVAWADRFGVGAGPDVVLARSQDRGETWSTVVRVSDDAGAAYQFFPWMCVGPDGVVSVMFHDQRDAPGTPRYHTYLAHSIDGGRSFLPNLRLSDEITDTSLDTAFLGTFIGDYNGIAASLLGVYPVWTDLRPSLADMEVFVRPLRPLGADVTRASPTPLALH